LAAAHAIAFDKVDLPGMYESLSYTHRQHQAIVHALENGEGTRVAGLMDEHAYTTKASINMARGTCRSGPKEAEVSPSEREPKNTSEAS
jgi:DNA-binding GntR family transcriptional regulator